MLSNLFLILMIAFIISNFYLVKEKLFAKITNKNLELFLHAIVYTIIGLIMFLLTFNKNVIWYIVGFILIHFICNTIKVLFFNENKKVLYIMEQLIHIIIIIVIASIYSVNHGDVSLGFGISKFINNFGFSSNQFLRVVLILLIIFKPTNKIFKEVFSYSKPVKEEAEEGKIKLGATIGNMERLLIIIFLFVGQYAAIGLVLTGKSIARYSLIVNNKEFAEYYLVGTLYSILASVIPFFIIWKL